MIRCSEPNVVGLRVCIVRPAGQMCRVVLFPGRILTVEYKLRKTLRILASRWFACGGETRKGVRG